MEITVSRAGKVPLPITQVPRVQKDDVIKARLLDEPVNGIKPDQSYWDWTFVVAYINPSRNTDKQKSVSEEIQFRKRGWYREYSFVVPYDSQPVFFLYPKPKYRDKILKFVNKKYEEISKLGEKTIEIAGAYAQINSFLNELQAVLYQTQYSRYAANNSNGSNYNPYGGFYNPFNPIGNNNQRPDIPFNYNAFIEQTIERLARSFNLQMPLCWQTNGYGNSYSSGNYGNNNNTNFGYAVSSDLISRAQCVAKNIRLEDFDLSVSQMLKQGGIMVATQLRDKYPQLTYWINLAAAAIDFIVKVFQKSPLRIVPTIASSSDSQLQNGGYQNNFPSYSLGPTNPSNPAIPNPVKISLFAESQPSEQGAVTAYPIIVQKWQANPDPEVISLYPPALAEACLHAGMNILKNTNLTEDSSADTFTRDFKLVISSSNGFHKEFPLKKNLGLGGWELNLTPEDLNSIPKIKMTLEAELTGRRGFNEIKSPKFDLPIAAGGTWQIKSESQKAFAVGARRRITLQNTLGSCRCLQSVTYKPSFGGQFVFTTDSKENSLDFSVDGREVSFELDATHFQAGQGQLEVRSYGGEPASLPLKLYPHPPNITDFKISRGDNHGLITGERLEQLQYVKINGNRANVVGNNPAPSSTGNLNNLPNGAIGSNPNNPLNIGQNQKLVIFDAPHTKQTAGTVSLELGLEDDRTFTYPKTFHSGPARPAVVAGNNNEIEGVFINKSLGENNAIIKNRSSKTDFPKLQLGLSKYSVVPIDVAEMSVVLQNKLTDYDFRTENIQIETRIEKSQPGKTDTPKATFEVLDGNTLRLNFTFNEQIRKFLGGRRIEFRIRDKERGDSDWYTIKQTFIRIPQITNIKCTDEMGGECQLMGEGIDYIHQVSTDGGVTWFPQGTSGLIAHLATNSQKTAIIPLLSNKKLLQIKLRDFPQAEGLQVTNYTLSNFVKAGRKKKSQVNNQSDLTGQPAENPRPNQQQIQKPIQNMNPQPQNPFMPTPKVNPNEPNRQNPATNRKTPP